MTPDRLRKIARDMIIDQAEDIERLSIHENLKYNLDIDDPDGAYATQIQDLIQDAIITVTWPTPTTQEA